MEKRSTKWEREVPPYVSFQRSVPRHREPILEIQLHSFGDASKKVFCAAVYAVVKQTLDFTQALVAAKSRLAKANLTIPRLELVAGHMAVNLAVNVCSALEGFPLSDYVYCWLDSTVALRWLNDNGEYRQFVANRVYKMKTHKNVIW